jgi:HK97 family phage portal protein
MNFLARTVAALRGFLPARRKQMLSGVDDSRGWLTIVRESFPGAWQADVTIDADRVLANWAVFACQTLIAADIGKLRLRLMEQDADGIWTAADSPAFSPVLRKPNHFQTRQKFVEGWITSKLATGNAYILKQRDQRGVVTALYVLDPTRVRPLVATNGDVYYQLHDDDLSRLPDSIPAVPASEIIHDTMVCLFHPLVGVSPIYACGLAAMQGLNILNQSAKFFANASQPGGVLTAPAKIEDETAERLKRHWEQNYSGQNAGRIAVLGDGLRYERMAMTAVEAQLADQLKLSAEMVCACYHVPAFKIGAGTIPAGQKVEDLNQIYYSDCLQSLIESLEACLDEGLGLPYVQGRKLGVELDLDDLLRMDSTTLTQALKEQVGAGITSPNEARARLNMRPTAGGATPYLQQQNYSLAALNKRDTADPFAAPAAPPPTPEDEAAARDQAEERVLQNIRRMAEVVRMHQPEPVAPIEENAQVVALAEKLQRVESEARRRAAVDRFSRLLRMELHDADVAV